MIAVSAGHNPNACGAGDNGFFEYPETQRWANLIYQNLRDAGVDARLIPAEDLTAKVQVVNGFFDHGDIKLAIEVHFNSCPGGGASGCETLFCPGSSKGIKLASIIQRKMATLMRPDRGTKEGWYKMDRPGIVDYDGDVDGDEHPDYFLKATKCTAVVIEPEFIQDRQKIEDNRDACCALITEALLRYLNYDDPKGTV